MDLVVHQHGICGSFMMISRNLVGTSFNLEVLIVFGTLCSCNNDGKNSILGCIGYKIIFTNFI
jgi:hypothetical protein